MIPGIIASAIRRAIAPPSTDPFWSDVKALLHFDGADGSTTFTDETGRIWTSAGGAGVALDTADKKYGSASLKLEGLSPADYIQTENDLDLSVSYGSVTIEAWIQLDELWITHTISNKRGGSGADEHSFQIDTSNTAQMIAFASGSPVVVLVGTTVMVTGVYYHVAVVKDGNDWRLYVDGVLEASATQSAPAGTNTQPLKIGRDGFNTGRMFKGHIDDYRFTRAARYSANFTPPIAPFPNS